MVVIIKPLVSDEYRMLFLKDNLHFIFTKKDKHQVIFQIWFW